MTKKQIQNRIESKILKTEPVKWKDLEILQTKNLKEMSKDSYGRLRASLIDNSFVQTLNVWANNGKLYCLDGYHRIKVMSELEKEGYSIPEELPANFIACRNRKDASKLVLIYSAIYANVTGEGLYEFMNSEGLGLDDLKSGIQLPEIDWDEFEKEFIKDNGGNGGDGVEHKSLVEKFLIPPFSVLDARQGYWQDRKRAWLALGIQSELGRGGGVTPIQRSSNN